MKRNIKIIACVLSAALFGTSLCACKKKGGIFAEPTPVPKQEAEAAVILTLDDAAEAVNGLYDIALDNASAVKEGNTTTVAYRSVPDGMGDPIIVTLTDYRKEDPVDMGWTAYEDGRLKRPAAVLVEGIGEDAYISYPSIHVYNKGYKISITAGSGSDEGQDNILKALAEKAVAKLDTFIDAE